MVWYVEIMFHLSFYVRTDFAFYYLIILFQTGIIIQVESYCKTIYVPGEWSRESISRRIQYFICPIASTTPRWLRFLPYWPSKLPNNSRISWSTILSPSSSSASFTNGIHRSLSSATQSVSLTYGVSSSSSSTLFTTYDASTEQHTTSSNAVVAPACYLPNSVVFCVVPVS